MSGHTVLVGFGVTGVNAARQLLDHGCDPADLVAVDRSTEAIERATALGARVVLGDGVVITSEAAGEAMGHLLDHHNSAESRLRP